MHAQNDHSLGLWNINLSGISLAWVLFRRMDAWEHLQNHLLLSECSSHPSPWITCFTLLTHNPKKQDAIKVFKWSNHGSIIRGEQWKISHFSILQLFQWHHNMTLWQAKWIPCIKNTTTAHCRASFTFWRTVPPLEMLLEEPNETLKCVNLGVADQILL
jgi:hypothetical protein